MFMTWELEWHPCACPTVGQVPRSAAHSRHIRLRTFASIIIGLIVHCSSRSQLDGQLAKL